MPRRLASRVDRLRRSTARKGGLRRARPARRRCRYTGGRKLAGERIRASTWSRNTSWCATGYVFGGGTDFVTGALERLRRGEPVGGIGDRSARRPSFVTWPRAPSAAPLGAIRHLSSARAPRRRRGSTCCGGPVRSGTCRGPWKHRRGESLRLPAPRPANSVAHERVSGAPRDRADAPARRRTCRGALRDGPLGGRPAPGATLTCADGRHHRSTILRSTTSRVSSTGPRSEPRARAWTPRRCATSCTTSRCRCAPTRRLIIPRGEGNLASTVTLAPQAEVRAVPPDAADLVALRPAARRPRGAHHEPRRTADGRRGRDRAAARRARGAARRRPGEDAA